ncbi:MAG: hypothetical protein QXO75_05575 [Nitrososphaerota archaeon]
MMLETHGEVCRLGYLRLIASIAKSNGTSTEISSDFIASILEDAVKKSESIANHSPRPNVIGLIKSRVTARNYVTLARGLKILDPYGRGLDINGLIYTSLRSASKFDAFLRGETVLSHRDLITLNQVEKFFFLYVVTVHDYLIMPGLIRWLCNQSSLTRMEGMNYLMEELYPQALKVLSMAASKKRRAELMAKLDEAMSYREKRLKYSSKTEWIRSSLYAKYRHIAPPRLEWLVDLDLLERQGRGRYEVSELLKNYREIITRALSHSPMNLVHQLFTNIAPLYASYAGKPSRQIVITELLNSYHVLSNQERRPVKLQLLEVVTSFRLLENNYLSTPRAVHEAINSLAVVYPDKIFISPGMHEELYVTRIDISQKELNM